MTAALALLPCPFCGDPMKGNITASELGFARGPYGSLMVQCDSPDCCVLGPSAQTMKSAVEAWNIRADIALPMTVAEAAKVLGPELDQLMASIVAMPIGRHRREALAKVTEIRALSQGGE